MCLLFFVHMYLSILVVYMSICLHITCLVVYMSTYYLSMCLLFFMHMYLSTVVVYMSTFLLYLLSCLYVYILVVYMSTFLCAHVPIYTTPLVFIYVGLFSHICGHFSYMWVSLHIYVGLLSHMNSSLLIVYMSTFLYAHVPIYTTPLVFIYVGVFWHTFLSCSAAPHKKILYSYK